MNENEKILNLLREHPNGLRLRSIGMYLNTYHMNLIDTIHKLKAEGLVKSRIYSDLANGEFYDIWSIA